MQPQEETTPNTQAPVGQSAPITQPATEPTVVQPSESVSAGQPTAVQGQNSFSAPQSSVDQASAGQTPVAQTLVAQTPDSQSSSQTTGAFVSGTPAVAEPTKNNAGKKKWLLGLALAVPLLLAGGAGAYYGIVLPNKPENVLKMAVVNSFSERNVGLKGTLDVESTDKKAARQSVQAMNIAFDIGTNEDKTFAGKINLAVSGVKVDADMRYVGESLYVKFGDLSAVSGLANGFMPGASTVLSKLENQWVEADKTLLKQANATCFLESDVKLTESDFKALNTAYDKNKFAEIKSTAKDTVNGKSAKKLELLIDDNKFADFYKNDIMKLESVKKLQECGGYKGSTSQMDSLKDGDKTPLTLWIADKKIVKIASNSTEQDAKKSKIKGKLETTVEYKKTSVEKPASAKPFMTLMSELQQSSGALGAPSASSSLRQ